MAHVFEKKWRSNDVRLQENADFSALLLSERVLEGLQKAGFKKPSPIQLQAIPMGKFGKDLMVQAKSGTGKTLVFVVTALEMLKRKLFRPQVLIIVPTREIATQVCSVVKAVGSSFHKLTCNSFIGGLPLFEDQEKAVMTQIVVGTPGRLRQLINLKSLPTNSIRLLIFDEADELLRSNSFKDDLEDIFTTLPDEKQVIATSATFSPKVKKMMLKYLGDPCLIRLNAKQLALLGMIHYATLVDYCPMPVIMYRAKLVVLEKILKTVKFAQCLLFCNGIQRVEVLYKDVKRFGFSVAYISSAKEQVDRLKAMERLKRFKCKVLVSSDLTSRGIDAENVDLVINFDLACTTEVYMHRVGRAGRYGSVGVAISIIDEKEVRYLQRIEKEGSFKTFKLPDPTPTDLILYPPEGEFLIDEPDSGNVDAVSEAEKSPMCNNALWNAFKVDEYGLENEVNTESIQANSVSNINSDEDNAFESELAAAYGIEKGDPEKEIIGKNIKVKDVFETSTDVDDNTIKYASSELAVDVKGHDDNTKHNEECEKIDEDVISHSKNKDIHFNAQMSDKILQNGYANNDSMKQDKNINLNLLNDCDENELISGKSTDKPSACDIQENSDFCDKNAFEKQSLVNDIIKNDTQFFETDNNKLSRIHTDNIPESCELKDIVLHLKDDFVNCEQENDAKSCDMLSNVIKTFLDTYESNKEMEATKSEATFDKDSQLAENSGKKFITIDMINNLKSRKQEFFYKTFKKFQERKNGSSASHKNEKDNNDKSNGGNSSTDLVIEEINMVQEREDEEKSNEGNPLTDLVIEEVNTTHEKLAGNSDAENKEISPEKPIFESTPQHNDKIKQDAARMTTDEADLKPTIKKKLSRLFPELSDESDSDTSETNGETSEVAKETSSISSASDSLSSESESSSSSSDSEDESGSETETSSESSSDSSSSSASSENENEESYHHNYSRTGRQNPSLVSGSVRGQVLNDRVYYDRYFEDHRCTSCGGRKKEIPRDSSNFSRAVGNPPYFFDHREISSCSRNAFQTGSRRGQNVADHNNIQSSSRSAFQTRSRREQNVADQNTIQSSLPRKHSRCHRSKHSSRNVTGGGGEQNVADHNTIQSCSRNAFQTTSRREQNVADHNIQSSLPRKRSRCHRSKHSSRNVTGGGGEQSRRVCLTHPRSSRHHHTSNCFLPTGHSCHPNTPDYPCSHGELCEIWYKTLYNQWLHIQRVIN